MKPYLLHAFSLDMLPVAASTTVDIEPVDQLPLSDYQVIIGTEVAARKAAEQLFGDGARWQELYRPGVVALRSGDEAYVVKVGGRRTRFWRLFVR